jgi:hypothetical protein
VNACKTLAGPKNTRSATRFNLASRLELPLLGSNQDSPDPERRPQGSKSGQFDRKVASRRASAPCRSDIHARSCPEKRL